MPLNALRAAWQHAFTLQFAFVQMLRLLAILGIVSVIILIYGFWFEGPYIRYQNLPFPVETPVEQGRTVPIIIERCNDSSREQAYMSSRTLVHSSGKKTMLPAATVSIPPGCSRDVSRSVSIPRETETGTYTITGEVIVQGIIKQHKTDWYTEPFEVIPMKGITKQLEEENDSERLHEIFRKAMPK